MQLVFRRTRDAKDSEKYSSVQGDRADLSDDQDGVRCCEVVGNRHSAAGFRGCTMI